MIFFYIIFILKNKVDNIMNKNILTENMKRFGTKNLQEDFDSNNNGYPDQTESSEISAIQNNWMKLTTELTDLVNRWKSGERKLERNIQSKYKEVEAAQKNLANALIGGERDLELIFTQMFYGTPYGNR